MLSYDLVPLLPIMFRCLKYCIELLRNLDIEVNCCDRVPLPVWIVHVFLSYFVRLGVHVDRMFRLAAHVVLPDDAALLGNLKVRRL